MDANVNTKVTKIYPSSESSTKFAAIGGRWEEGRNFIICIVIRRYDGATKEPK